MPEEKEHSNLVIGRIELGAAESRKFRPDEIANSSSARALATAATCAAIDATSVASEYRSFICGEKLEESQTWLEIAAEAISAHLRDRYELTIKEGKADLTFNELMGIIANTHEQSKMRGYIGPIREGDRFQWDPMSDAPAVVEVTKIDVALQLVWTKLIAGEGPAAEVFNTEAKFRKFCKKI